MDCVHHTSAVASLILSGLYLANCLATPRESLESILPPASQQHVQRLLNIDDEASGRATTATPGQHGRKLSESVSSRMRGVSTDDDDALVSAAPVRVRSSEDLSRDFSDRARRDDVTASLDDRVAVGAVPSAASHTNLSIVWMLSEARARQVHLGQMWLAARTLDRGGVSDSTRPAFGFSVVSG